MFTDIVGYTALMEKNEKRAFQVLNKNLRIHKIKLDHPSFIAHISSLVGP